MVNVVIVDKWVIVLASVQISPEMFKEAKGGHGTSPKEWGRVGTLLKQNERGRGHHKVPTEGRGGRSRR